MCIGLLVVIKWGEIRKIERSRDSGDKIKAYYLRNENIDYVNLVYFI